MTLHATRALLGVERLTGFIALLDGQPDLVAGMSELLDVTLSTHSPPAQFDPCVVRMVAIT